MNDVAETTWCEKLAEAVRGVYDTQAKKVFTLPQHKRDWVPHVSQHQIDGAWGIYTLEGERLASGSLSGSRTNPTAEWLYCCGDHMRQQVRQLLDAPKGTISLWPLRRSREKNHGSAIFFHVAGEPHVLSVYMVSPEASYYIAVAAVGCLRRHHPETGADFIVSRSSYLDLVEYPHGDIRALFRF